MREFSSQRKEPREVLDGKIELNIHFGPHDSSLDFVAFQQLLNQADVYIPEIPLLTPDYRDRLSALAAGNSSDLPHLKTVLPGDFAHATLEAISSRRQKTGKKLEVAIVDIPSTDEWKEKMRLIKFFGGNLLIQPTLEQTLEGISQQAQIFVSLQDERNDVIANNLYSYLQEKSKELGRMKRPLKVIMSIGYLHTDLVSMLSDLGIPITATQNSLQDNSEYFYDSVVRCHQHGEIPSRELLMRSLISSMINDPRISSPDTPMRIMAIRKIVGSIPADNLQGICEEVISLANSKGEIGSEEASGLIMMRLIGSYRLDHEGIKQLLDTLK